MHNSPHKAGFTRIETLVAIVVFGTLGIGLVSASDVNLRFARLGKAKTTFSQWATACTLYKKEYGAYLPNLGVSYSASRDVMHQLDDSGRSLLFVKHLYGKNLDGTALTGGPAGERVRFNRQAMEFCEFKPADFLNYSDTDGSWMKNPQLQDAFGNTAIRVCFDLNNDGQISELDGVLPDRILPAGTPSGIPGRVMIFTTYRDLGQGNPKLDAKDAADIVVIL